MENGSYFYKLEANTPQGKKRGELNLIVWNSFLSGDLTMYARRIPFQNGWCDGTQIFFRGEMKTLLKLIPYQASGTATENKIDLVLATKQENYFVSGFPVDAGRNG